MKDPIRPAKVNTPLDLVFHGARRSRAAGGGRAEPNPYVSVDMHADFRSPAGRALRLSGFWDGGDVWKVRFTPPEPGLWSYETGAEGDESLDGLRGSVSVRQSGRPGFITRDPEYPFAFRRDGAGRVFLMGDTLWNGMSDCGGRLDFPTYARLLRIRARQRFNFIRSYVCSFYPEPDTAEHSNRGGPAFEPWHPDRLNPAYFREADRRIALANSLGLAVHLVFGSDMDNLTAFFGWGSGKLERYIRYCCARFGGFGVCWEGRAEYEEQKDTPPGAVPLANAIGRWVESCDPYDHVRSMHTVRSNNALGGERWLDWIMHQAQEWDLIVRDRRFGKPVMNEEFYYENSGAGATHRHHADADTVRRGAWKVMTAGASGLAYGNTGTLAAQSMPFGGLKHARSPGARAMSRLHRFWSRLRFWELAPPGGNGRPAERSQDMVCTPSPGSGGAAASGGRQYVAYLEHGGTRSIALPAGRYRRRFYNPRTRSWRIGWKSFATSGEERSFRAPDSKDWVLCIDSRRHLQRRRQRRLRAPERASGGKHDQRQT